MGKFKYRIMNSDGERSEGIIEADSKDDVIKNITEKGYYPLLIEELNQKGNINLKFANKVKIKDIAIFCRQFYTMLNAGVPILECLDLLSNQNENINLNKALKCIKEDVEKGEVLSKAMEKHKDVFPKLLISLIESGEASGKLNSIMYRMSSNYEKEYKINNKIKNAMMYPMILGMVSIGIVIFILAYVMPTFLDIFEKTGVDLPLSTKIIIWLSLVIKNHYIIVITIIGLLIFLVKTVLKTEKGIIFIDNLKFKIPIIKKMNQMIIVSRFTRNLSILINSGLQLVDALTIVSKVCDNVIAEEQIVNIQKKIIQGESLHFSMKKSEIFPKMLHSMIKIGEDTGALDDILNKTADFYDEELESCIQKSITLIEPLLIMIMGMIISFMLMAIMLPMFSSYSNL